jgi:predicted N-acyltransferase
MSDYSEKLEIKVVGSLAEIEPEEWNALSDKDPFLKHGFLHGLEKTDCLEPQGWYPQHLVVMEKGLLVGALPLFVRDNSYGEFVFDWSWADAYERAGGRYYPKLVSAVPFSPVMGQRLLVDRSHPAASEIVKSLINTVRNACENSDFSSWHCLFPHESEMTDLKNEGLLVRLGCQYHWLNDNYRDFDDFLGRLISKKRKQIKRERRKVTESELSIEVLEGQDISADHWSTFYNFYCSTFERKWGAPRFTEDFFQQLQLNLPDTAVLLLASDRKKIVAGAFALRGGDTLYGRHWGCAEHYDNLHFELCYYRTIEFCIEKKLRRLDAGAQGEHKIARGFVPVRTWSAHWLKEQSFRSAVRQFLVQETNSIEEYLAALGDHSAFRA